MADALEIHPLTPDRWDDLVDLFGPERGAQGGCWCVWPFMRGVDFNAMAKADRKAMFRQRVEEGNRPPGLLAYADGQAVGWVAVGPRPGYGRLQISKATRPLQEAEGGMAGDDERTWMIACFFIRSTHRNTGVMRFLAEAAAKFASSQGGAVLEACPIEPDRPLYWGEGFVGIAPLFRELGYAEIARRSPRRPLMRLELGKS